MADNKNNTDVGNTGSRNSGNYNSGDFNTDAPTVRLFNKDTGKKRGEISIPHINLPTAEWIPDTEMSAAEKKANPQFHVAGGVSKEAYL